MAYFAERAISYKQPHTSSDREKKIILRIRSPGILSTLRINVTKKTFQGAA